MKEQLQNLVNSWRKYSKALDYENELLVGSRYYSSLTEEERKEYNKRFHESLGYGCCANDLEKVIKANYDSGIRST